MDELLCGICHTSPKKYKCPTCSMPYCSISCFKEHKTVHDAQETNVPAVAAPVAADIPQPLPPAPVPRYLKQKVDFSLVASNPRFQELLKSHTTLLPALQRIYAATIEPDPAERRRWNPRNTHRGEYNARIRGRGRGRGWGNRGRGRGGGFDRNEEPPGWTQKKGDAEASRILKGLRAGIKGEVEQEAISQFIELVDATLGEGRRELE